MAAVRCGLSSVVPLHVLTVMTPLDMEIRTCGQPSLDLGFLKVCYAFFLVVQLPLCHLYYISLFVELTIPAYNLIVAEFLDFCFLSSRPTQLTWLESKILMYISNTSGTPWKVSLRYRLHEIK